MKSPQPPSVASRTDFAKGGRGGIIPFCHSRGNGNPGAVPAEAGNYLEIWIPAFAGMTIYGIFMVRGIGMR